MTLIIFDVDGTLVDSQTMITTAMATTFHTVGLTPPARDRVLGIVGLSLPEAMARLVPEADDVLVARMVAAYKDQFQTLRADPACHEPLYPGARAALERLKARDDVTLALATGKSRRGVRAILDLHGLDGLFASIQTADDHPSKPHPAMIHAAMAETGAEAHRTVMIGDASFDMVMARAAGAFALGVGWGYQTVAALEASGAHAILGDYADLEPALARLLNW